MTSQPAFNFVYGHQHKDKDKDKVINPYVNHVCKPSLMGGSPYTGGHPYNGLCSLEDDYMNTTYYMSDEELKDFKEDNAGNFNQVNSEFNINSHWQYYNFLNHLQDLTYRMPLYSYKEGKLTRYYSPEPPRAFTTFFKDLDLLWDKLLQDISVCFTLPVGADISDYETPRVITYKPYKRLLNQSKLVGSDETFFSLHGFVACGEVWIVDSGEDQPDHHVGLPFSLHLNILRYYYHFKFISADSNTTSYLNYSTYFRSDLMVMELLKIMSSLPTLDK